MPVLVAIIDAGSSPVYLAIGKKAHHLRELGLSDRRIARAIGVSDKTVARSLQLFRADDGRATADRALDADTD
jgi:IS30 family transposase